MLSAIEGKEQWIWGIEGYNERLPESAPKDEHIAYDIWNYYFAKGVKDAGFEPILMNFANGNFPYPGKEKEFVEWYNLTLQNTKYIGVHGYLSPNSWGNMIVNGTVNWLLLRYRKIKDAIDKYYKGENKGEHEFIMTEVGLTHAVDGDSDVGWLMDDMPESEYLSFLEYCDREFAKDEYLLSACVFVTGASVMWETFDSTKQVERILSNG